MSLIKTKQVKKEKQIRDYTKKPLWDKDGIISKDIGFELQFGFRDTLDIPQYVESPGFEIRNLPKKIEIYD